MRGVKKHRSWARAFQRLAGCSYQITGDRGQTVGDEVIVRSGLLFQETQLGKHSEMLYRDCYRIKVRLFKE